MGGGRDECVAARGSNGIGRGVGGNGAGAGGAARAIVFGLIERGITHIHVANRNVERAQALRERFGERVNPLRWDERSEVLAGAGLLVNTTTLGMAGQPGLDINLGRLPAGAVVADIVYSPLETELLKAAAERGLRRVDGLGMLLHQGRPAWKAWFGVEPDVTPELRALIEATI